MSDLFQSETFTVTTDQAATFGASFDDKVDGTNGPLQRSLPRWIPDIHMPFLDALKTLGILFNPNNVRYLLVTVQIDYDDDDG